ESFSFYEIRAVERGHSMELHDLFRDKTVTVYEARATENAPVGGIVYAMTIEMFNVGILVGCSDIIFPATIKPAVLDFKKHLLGRKRKMATQDLYELQYEVLDFYRRLYDTATSRS